MTGYPPAAARLAAAVGGVLGAPLGARTTYRVGGPAAVGFEAATVDDLRRLQRALGEDPLPVVVVGRGSNLLVADDGFPGVAVTLAGDFEVITIEGTTVVAGGAVPLPVLARRSVAEGLAGLEWAVGVPGSVGGAVRMNAGGHGSDVAATLVEVRRFDLVTGHDDTVPAADLALAYRHSDVGAAQVVVTATFGLERGDPSAGERLLAEVVAWRREHQPGGQNAGSVFTNPPGDSAGRLIDAAGLKGLRIGTAEVSTKHANFIQADAGGRAGDVVALMTRVREEVAARFGVVLEPETRLVGFPAGVLQ